MCLTCSLFLLFLKETPKAFWGKTKAPGLVQCQSGDRAADVSLLQRPSEHCFEKPSCALFFCSVDLWASRFNHWLLPMNAIEKMPGNLQPPKYLTLVPSTDRKSIFFGTRNHQVWNIILASRCVSYIKIFILASYFHYTDENTGAREDTWLVWNQ